MNPLESLLDYAKNNVPFYQRRAPEQHLNLDQWPLMWKGDLVTYSLDASNDLLSSLREPGGYIVASGGTTARPKYIYASHSEFAAVSLNIAKGFLANGMERGDRVVNYFGAGDMCGSYTMVDKALSSLPVTVFPLSYTPRTEYSLEILERFRPNVIIGIPSLILALARHGVEQGKQLSIQKVFYGGEPITRAAKDLLTSIWQCNLVRSAGYATTDVGSIGWQCPHCKDGEHFAFDDIIVEVVEDEIVVTSLNRRAMPIIRYRTGDRGKWVTPSCECGEGVRPFKLLGRLDAVMIVWGCSILYDEVVLALNGLGIGFSAMQVQVYSQGAEDFLVVKVEMPVAPESRNDALIRDRIYQCCGELNATDLERNA